jgi:aspartate oxidase
MKNFKELSEREILALAISLEEEDERVYADFSKVCARIMSDLPRCSKACEGKSRNTGVV